MIEKMEENREILKLRRVRPSSVLPSRATAGSAGYDLYADLDSPVLIAPGEARRIPTGIALALPPETVGLVFGRSGLGTKFGIVPANAVGVIDGDFRGEIVVTLRNQSAQPYEIVPGDRVAQLVIVPVLTPAICETQSLDETGRGAGGWGSTGR